MKGKFGFIGLVMVALLALFTVNVGAQTVQQTGLAGGTSIVAAGTNSTAGDFSFGLPRSRSIAVQASFTLMNNQTNSDGTVALVLQCNVKGTNYVTWGKSPVTTFFTNATKQCQVITNFDSGGFSNWRGYFENGCGVVLTNVDVSIGQKSGL